jgi:hypothetical protein
LRGAGFPLSGGWLVELGVRLRRVVAGGRRRGGTRYHLDDNLTHLHPPDRHPLIPTVLSVDNLRPNSARFHLGIGCCGARFQASFQAVDQLDPPLSLFGRHHS